MHVQSDCWSEHVAKQVVAFLLSIESNCWACQENRSNVLEIRECRAPLGTLPVCFHDVSSVMMNALSKPKLIKIKAKKKKGKKTHHSFGNDIKRECGEIKGALWPVIDPTHPQAPDRLGTMSSCKFDSVRV